MTTEEKHLLDIDLCARVFNSVFCWVEGAEEPKRLVGFHVEDANNIIYKFEHNGLHNLEVYSSEVKPYLRPMSSMTEEEQRAYRSIDCGFNRSSCWLHTERLIDWLIANHFDFRGLIPLGLALEAPEGMYKTE